MQNISLKQIQDKKNRLFKCFMSKSIKYHMYILNIHKRYMYIGVLCLEQGSYGQGKPGKPGKVREFQKFSKVREFKKKLNSWRIFLNIQKFLKILKSLKIFKTIQKNREAVHELGICQPF